MLAFCAIAFACLFVFHSMRTWSYGTQWIPLLVLLLFFFALFAFPFMVVILWGSSFRKALLGAVALTVFSIGGAEAFASAEEWALILKFGKQPNQNLTIRRWLCGDQYIIYRSIAGSGLPAGWFAFDCGVPP